MNQCKTPGCEGVPARRNYPFCPDCWKNRSGEKSAPAQSSESGEGFLSATKIAEGLGLKSPVRANLILAELGWIAKQSKGWSVTAIGESFGGVQRKIQKTGVPFVMWKAEILRNSILREAAKDLGESAHETAAPKSESATSGGGDFRARFADGAKFRATDGHWVRSKAEALIDNWLYMNGLVHAYERKLPVQEEAFCDFYLPQRKVYIEYWGLEENPKYAARKQAKIAVYKKYKMALIELGEKEVENLDDHLPRLLREHGISVD